MLEALCAQEQVSEREGAVLRDKSLSVRVRSNEAPCSLPQCNNKRICLSALPFCQCKRVETSL